ncbi:MBL fold metallo-hydrolase [Rhodotorula paludigena]|uniref:MBL fold metallo-hydrolase n=1 Tax=Rhodotorula paludigena TaxID=86838 RepID=UPI00317A5647
MQSQLDLLLLGTGTSSSIPSVACLTDETKGCWCCRSTLNKTDAEGQKNARRNTSAVLRVKPSQPDAQEKVILIDCGKTFFSAAVEHWPKAGLREIDAVILTHAHADAILGLDDLRGWTLRGAIQKSIPIYCTQETFNEVSKAFGYLTNTGSATGGGDIPALTWHIFPPDESFELCGVRVTPLAVHHGKFFTTPPSPYPCLGFLFNAQILYLSDVSYIPETVWAQLDAELALARRPVVRQQNGTNNTNGDVAKKEKPRLQALVIDCLRIEPFTSHFGIGQAVQAARRLHAQKSYLIGFGHRTSHAAWRHFCELMSTSPPTRTSHPVTASESIPSAPYMWELYNGHPDPTKEDRDVFAQRALQAVEAWEAGADASEKGGEGDVRIRPARDGMTIRTGPNGVDDDEYN